MTFIPTITDTYTFRRALISILLLYVLLQGPAIYAQPLFTPPPTKAIPVIDTLHDFYLTDNYRWLENKDDPAVVEWTRQEHDYGIRYLKATQKTHPGVRDEISANLNIDFESELDKEGGRVFQIIKKKGDKQNKLYTILNGRKILIWDPVQLDSSGNTAIDNIQYTYDGERAAILVQQNGHEIRTVYIINTRTGQVLYPPLQNINSFSWTRDQKKAYLVFRSQEDIDKQRPLRAYQWKVGENLSDTVFEGSTTDAERVYFVYDNRYADFSFYGDGDFWSNNCYMWKSSSGLPGKLIYQSKKYEAFPEGIGNKLYIRTNEQAPNFKLMVADENNPEFNNWKPLIPESASILQDYLVTKTNIIIQAKKDIQSRIFLYDLQGKKIKEISLPETGNVSSIGYDREEDSVYLTLKTFTSPPKIFIASPKNFKWRLFYERILPADMHNIVGEIKFYYSKDSTRVPVFLIHRKDISLDGKNPVAIIGYGGFNSGIEPGYQGALAPLLNRGIIIVRAGIRGGNEYGENWHYGGMLNNKQHCFDDFNACTEWLIREKYTNPSKILAWGRSNGGLLMGAIATQRPDLYKAIICGVPLLDMIRYQKFLIARLWIPEYGTSDNDADFRWLLKYSPYHNIRLGVNMPTMLVNAGANDARVDPMNAKKFVAAAQNNSGQINPIILHVDYNSGHGSGQQTEQRIDNDYFDFEFILNEIGN